MENLNDKIARVVRAWHGWSRAERERIDDIVEEVLQHCRDGQGNRFIANWCKWFLDFKSLERGSNAVTQG